MLKKGFKLYSIITGKCPKCHEESMYFDKKSFSLTNILKMNEKCSHCGLKYQLEPSFFYGAMHVSYGLNVLVMIAVSLIVLLGFKGKANAVVLSMLLSVIILFPIIMRLSRNIYINIFVNFEQSKSEILKK